MRIFPPYVQPFLLRIGTADFAYVKSICAGEGMTNGPKSTPFSPRHDTSLRSLHGWHRTSVDWGFQSFYRTEGRKVSMKSVLCHTLPRDFKQEQPQSGQCPFLLLLLHVGSADKAVVQRPGCTRAAGTVDDGGGASDADGGVAGVAGSPAHRW